MCLVVLAWQQHPEFPLIIAGNRDEFHGRPTERASWWSDAPDIVGGRDLQAGGTWLALHRKGRFATVTNFRDAELPSAKYRSRGHLVTDFLNGADAPRTLAPGIYGLSNALLDSPWSKVIRSKAALKELIRHGKVNETELFRLLDDRTKAPVDEVESGHLPFAKAPFIVLPDYGTRSSSVALLDAAGCWRFNERRFDAAGNKTGDTAFTITPKNAV